MGNERIKLLLPALEAEVVGEALELYLRARPAPLDHRYEYRYRAAAGVLAALHFLWLAKVGRTDQYLYAAILTVLLGIRVADWARRALKRRAAAVSLAKSGA